MGQLVRALEANGPCRPQELTEHVGAAYWEQGHFDRALGSALGGGLVHMTAEGPLATTG